uniref:Uncharacterized protein n=1 Tax=Monodelphis domestica TaxID=13616 RepID=A0A5F8GKV1_MONDO
MREKKNPTKPKKQLKSSSEEGYWDCTACAIQYYTETFKGMTCNVMRGTSTGKPRTEKKLSVS